MQMTKMRERREISPANDLTGRKPKVRIGVRYAGAHADYRREDYIFARAQSPEMRQQEWEDRLPPLKHWGSNLVANLAWQIFA
ncbi:MAG: hypothetical protein JSR55_07975 [Proteobacteria bacterium]|nr:hypothetical protein [Pseudomonadota bacterium]